MRKALSIPCKLLFKPNTDMRASRNTIAMLYFQESSNFLSPSHCTTKIVLRFQGSLSFPQHLQHDTAAVPLLKGTAVFFILLTTAFLLFATGCSPNPPQIQSISARLILYPGIQGIPEERLSLFVAVRDKDGIGDIAHVFIYNTKAELLWNLTPDNWTVHKDAGEIWIGSNGLVLPSGTIPRGSYTVELIDRAGEKEQKQIPILVPQKLPGNLPQISKGSEPDTLLIQADYTQLTLFFFDAGGNVIKAFPAVNGITNISKLWGNDGWKTQAASCAVYAYDAKNQIGLFSWILTINK